MREPVPFPSLPQLDHLLLLTTTSIKPDPGVKEMMDSLISMTTLVRWATTFHSSDIHYEGMPLNHTHLPQSLGKCDVYDSGVRALHNSSMPLSFVFHNRETSHLPLLVATNGTHHHIGHLQPIDHATTVSSARMNRRNADDINPDYTHVGKGGVKVQCNWKSGTMTDTQVREFMDEPVGPKTKKAGLDFFLDIVNYLNFAGFSFSEWIKDGKGNFTSGQWAMEGETNGFGSNWESNWDWCFGVDETNCEKEL